MVMKLYNIKGNNTIAGIYLTYLIFLNNRFKINAIAIAAKDNKINTKIKFIRTPPSSFMIRRMK
jgi:hypothetical protein